MKRDHTQIRLGRKPGFSLVELLVIIVIIAALAALSFTVVSKLREQAHSATCTSNLRQIGVYYELRAIETNGLMGPYRYVEDGSNWASSISNEYFEGKNREIFQCPGYQKRYNPKWTVKNGTAYSHTRDLDQDGKNWCPDEFNFRQVASPFTTPLIFDGTPGGNPTWATPYVWYSDKISNRSVGNYHNNGHNVVFCDGHVEYVKAK